MSRMSMSMIVWWWVLYECDYDKYDNDCDYDEHDDKHDEYDDWI